VRLLHARIHIDDEAAPDRHPDPDNNQIKHRLSGNLCRCAAYPEIIAAVKKRAAARG
jgi:aerobic-type carbon monoxide dehydrogenase small subunit (CoxS/CutS family)